ncbi:MAG: LptF/LptG family permease [Spirochaetales bacterium]|jgi:lipopolysaccharide export system permease protein|nr:LptF/LptG family permease [Spirochaetales bacterium]
MKTLAVMVVRSFIPVFIVALSFFVLILEMVDLFANLWRYLNQDVSFAQIMMIQLMYLPKCVSFATPISVLFSTAYCLGESYSRNELIAVFGAGIPLFRFVIPLLAIGVVVSFLGFVFEENYVIDTFRQKNQMVKDALNESVTFSNSNVTVLGENIRTIYHTDYYNDQNNSLTGLIVTKRSEEGGFLQRIDAESALWNEEEGVWKLTKVRVFTVTAQDTIKELDYETLTDRDLTLPPENFRTVTNSVEEMRREEAKEWIEKLRRAGLPYREALTAYYNRFSFTFAPLVVALLSSAIGGRFRKNILLMSLLSSLVFSVIYYVTQMVMRLLATHGYIAPVVGAWFALILFLVFGVLLMRNART